jgi:hypothetical protein
VQDIGLKGRIRDRLALLYDGEQSVVGFVAFACIVEGFDDRKFFVEVLEDLLAFGVLERVFGAFEGEEIFAFVEGIELVDTADGAFDDLGVGFTK